MLLSQRHRHLRRDLDPDITRNHAINRTSMPHCSTNSNSQAQKRLGASGQKTTNQTAKPQSARSPCKAKRNSPAAVSRIRTRRSSDSRYLVKHLTRIKAQCANARTHYHALDKASEPPTSLLNCASPQLVVSSSQSQRNVRDVECARTYKHTRLQDSRPMLRLNDQDVNTLVRLD